MQSSLHEPGRLHPSLSRFAIIASFLSARAGGTQDRHNCSSINTKLLLNVFIDDIIVLRTPHSVHTLTSKEKLAIAVYRAQKVSTSIRVKHLTCHLPNTVEKYGRIRIIGESERVRSVYGQNSGGRIIETRHLQR